MVSVETPNLNAFLARPPKTRIGLVRLLWPRLQACIEAGHSLRDIHDMLRSDGIEMAYSTLCWAVAALRQNPPGQNGAAMGRTTPSTAPLTPRETARRVGSPADPLHNLKRLQNVRPGFDYTGTLADEKLFGPK